MTKAYSTYNIHINELQRQLIEHTLELFHQLPHTVKESSLMPLDTPDNRQHRYSNANENENSLVEEVALLLDMVKDMPQVESENPGTIHGLCL